MANMRRFNLKQFSFLVLLLIVFFGSFSLSASTDSRPQMINLNMQFKSNNKILKSDLSMPFYQTAELSKKFDKKNVLIEVNPRRGKNSNEVAIEMRFYKASGSKAFAKKDFIAIVGEESKLSIKGMQVSITPVL